MKKFFSFFLLFLMACAAKTVDEAGPKPPSGNQFMENPSFCNVDADCTCGGIDRNTENCFIGNKLYASKNVDFTRDCPDFCTGIAGNLETNCVENKCQSVQRSAPAQPPEGEPVYCTMDAKECPDGSYVGRVPPNCEFAPCPESAVSDLSRAHWLCEDNSWAMTPEDCFENSCYAKGDCQLMGVKSPCGPYLIAGPTKTLHKPPVYYADRCGAEKCVAVEPDCSAIIPLDQINGFDCIDLKCVPRIRESY
jgi:hypothetical protein